MDPNANLAEQLRIIERLSAGDGSEDDVDRLCELVLALHEWLANGGFPPSQWRPSEDRKLAATIRAAIKLDRQADSGHESAAHRKFRDLVEKLAKL